MSTGQILFDDLKELCSPMDELFSPENDKVEIPSSPKYKIAKHMDWFVERAGKVGHYEFVYIQILND